LNGKSSTNGAESDPSKSGGSTTEEAKPADQIKQKALKKLLNF
jgi:AsmA protein